MASRPQCCILSKCYSPFRKLATAMCGPSKQTMKIAKPFIISDKALSKMPVVCTEQCRAVASLLYTVPLTKVILQNDT